MKWLSYKRLLIVGFCLALTCIAWTDAHAQQVRVDNSAKYGWGRYMWTVYLVANDETLSKVDYVQYTLHESFPQPVQIVRTRGARCAFGFSSSSWSEFEMKVKVVFKDGRSTNLKYALNLLKNKNAGDACNPRAPARRGTRD